MKKGTSVKPYPYRAPIKNILVDDDKMQAGEATLLGQTINLKGGVPKMGPDMYTATKVVNMDELLAENQDKTLEDNQYQS
jgi:hypothetical protein